MKEQHHDRAGRKRQDIASLEEVLRRIRVEKFHFLLEVTEVVIL